MEHQVRCPHDGFRMAVKGGESHPDVEFNFYECPECNHQMVEAIMPGGEIKHRTMIMCKCRYCRAERSKRNPEIKEYFPDL
jgi:hypothetical protein